MIPLSKARALAEKVCEELAPACDQLAIGGSIRRGLPMVGDLDIIALPRPGMEKELSRLFRSCAAIGGLILDGAISKRCLLRRSEIQCDLWVARQATMDLIAPLPCNWGAMFLTYTGSKEHNLKIVQRARNLDKTFRPGWGVVEESGRVYATTEDEIFAALEWDFVEPADRL
jgi:DNA polymerase/3'-5' exonuclease PolX